MFAATVVAAAVRAIEWAISCFRADDGRCCSLHSRAAHAPFLARSRGSSAAGTRSRSRPDPRLRRLRSRSPVAAEAGGGLWQAGRTDLGASLLCYPRLPSNLHAWSAPRAAGSTPLPRNRWSCRPEQTRATAALAQLATRRCPASSVEDTAHCCSRCSVALQRACLTGKMSRDYAAQRTQTQAGSVSDALQNEAKNS